MVQPLLIVTMPKTRRQRIEIKHERPAQLDKLAKQLKHHDDLYYKRANQKSAIMNTTRWGRHDNLADQLNIPSKDRYTAGFGDDTTSGFAKVVHQTPMLSLEKLTQNKRDSKGQAIDKQLTDWATGLQKALNTEEISFVVEPKIDGISASLIYEDGQLAQAATRSDGKTGDDITAQVIGSACVPQHLSQPVPGRIEVRGEIYLPHESFHALNKQLAADGKELLINPHNACAGLMKRKDAQSLTGIGIGAFVYHLDD